MSADDGVALFAYYPPKNSITKMDYLSHNLMHIIIGFSDFLLEFCDVEECKRKPKVV
ncbi:MAG: hypothetical protein Q4C78_00895 [Synergistaceae bacterium]|nr:hypothetical protein [Synergistaceae bacterium]